MSLFKGRPTTNKPVMIWNDRKVISSLEKQNLSPSPRLISNRHSFYWPCKWILDYALVIPTILLIWPMLLIIAVLIKLDSPGPVFYRRRVLGVNGREFDAFKFRTMYLNGHKILAKYPKLKAELEREYKLPCDPRVTRVGHILRRLSLDELPQLFNILRREMTLVGPRIITRQELSFYGAHSTKLISVLPGLTGLWQVSGRSTTTYDERVRLDMVYIDNWSLIFDIKIILRTIPAVASGEGAY